MQQSLQFILVPDSSAARRLKRILATQSPRHGTVVGTWPELVSHANSAYLVPSCKVDLKAIFIAALKNIPNAYWSNSLDVSTEESATEVEKSFVQIVSATNPEGPIAIADSDQLAQRPRKHIQDIVKLATDLVEYLPEPLSAVRRILSSDSNRAIRTISICYTEGYPSLTRWQKALVEKLNTDSAVEPSSELSATLNSMIKSNEQSPNSSALQALQNNLFTENKSDDKQTPDNSVQWLGVRDYLEEAEIAAGMVQRILSEDDSLSPCDVGILVPDSFEYSYAISDTFSSAGLTLSGLPLDHSHRDLGQEALFHFLHCRQKPAPVMALADCLSSPLMPWSLEQGVQLAQSVMNGNNNLNPFNSATANDLQMLDLLREGDTSTESLDVAIQSFVMLLANQPQHINRAKSLAAKLSEALAGAAVIDWKGLCRLSTPRDINTGNSPDFNTNGITVWSESQEPWRSVRYLIVFDFTAGHYPEVSSESPVFVTDDLDAIGEHLDLTVITPSILMGQRRARLKRQLAAVSDFVSFMVPRRNGKDAKQSPSESLVFMQQLFADIDDADGMILELDLQSDLNQARFVQTIEAAEAQTMREIVVEDVDLGVDLLSLQKGEGGNLKPESPSSLETLMVSRLAWLMRKLKAEPSGWAPEKLDVLLMGTLAHDVFENLFEPNQAIPDKQAINLKVGELLELAIQRNAPFLHSAQWQVEREHLAAGITQAAIAWGDVLSILGAEILGSEQWLEGSLAGVPIHGQVDMLLALPDGRLLVVDYKRSSSSSRRPRMVKGYDSQASLYRTMLKTGGAKCQKINKVLEKFRQLDSTGIVYFMMNDQVSLSDALVVESGAIPGWEVLSDDVSIGANELIAERLDEVRHGQLFLNRTGDTSFFENTAGIKPYALGNSPLIPLFTIHGESREDT